MPRAVDVVNEAFLDAVLEEAGCEPEPQPAQSYSGNGYPPFDMEAFIARHGLRVKTPKHDAKFGTKYILEECPNDPSHKAPDSFLGVMPSGAPYFHCSHSSCSGYKWQQLRERLEPGYRNKKPDWDARSKEYHGFNKHEPSDTTKPAVEYQSLTLADLKNVPAPEYLIDGILELSQPGVIAGQFKSLKTTMATALSYCLCTGNKFLGQFEPNRTARVGMFSGEAGPRQLRGLIQRIAASYGDTDPWRHDGLIISCERLPKIGEPSYMEALVRWIDQHKLELCIIDPGYAALAAIGDSAGNYYKVADLLFQVTELQKQTGCIILLCPHMTKAPKYDPPMLSDIQWSGFSEWSGQWLLLGKRQEWNDETGQHWLWFVAGGRSGHASTWGLDVREGRRDDPGGKVFEVSVVNKGDAFNTAHDADAERRQRAQSREQDKAEKSIRDAFRAIGSGLHIKTHVLERTGCSSKGKAIQAAWATMLRKGEIVVTPDGCLGANKKPYDGYSWNPPKG